MSGKSAQDPTEELTADAAVKLAAREEIHEISVKLGQAIRTQRQARDMTQADLATNAELDPNFIGMVERAERRITLYNAWRIAGGLGMSLSELVQPLHQRKTRSSKKRTI